MAALTFLAAGLWGAAPALGAAGNSTVVSGLVVGGPVPKVASTYPADGTEVPAGTLVLKIAFDQPMTPDGWSYGRSGTAGFPHCLAQPRLLGDQHTFVLLCSVAAHQSYALEINTPSDFKSENGRSARPAVLRFTTAGTGPRTIHDALAAAGLTDEDDPVMTWRDTGAGVSQSTPAAPDSAGASVHR